MDAAPKFCMQAPSPRVLSTARPLTTSGACSPRCCCPPSLPLSTGNTFSLSDEGRGGATPPHTGPHQVQTLTPPKLPALSRPWASPPSSSRFPILLWLVTVAGEAGCLAVGLYLASSVPKVWSNLSCFGIIPSSHEGGAERAICPSPGTRVLTSSGLGLLCICPCVLSQFSHV